MSLVRAHSPLEVAVNVPFSAHSAACAGGATATPSAINAVAAITTPRMTDSSPLEEIIPAGAWSFLVSPFRAMSSAARWLNSIEAPIGFPAAG